MAVKVQGGLFDIQITHVRLEHVDGQEPTIVLFRWFRAADGAAGEMEYDDLAKYLAAGGGAFFKPRYGSPIPVVVERHKQGRPVVRVGVGHRRDHKLTNLPDF